MSVPFSNTSLRIPRGFGNLLEGLAREVLRVQPEDIPSFAADYFTELLKAREESGLDPAEWGAKLEDRFCNNHLFKSTVIQENIISPKANTRNTPDQSETFGNNETQHSALQNLNINSEDYEPKENDDINKKLDEESGESEHRPAADIPHVRAADVDICAPELKDSSEIPEQTLDVLQDDEVTNEAEDIDICRSEIEPTPLPSFGGLANVDVCGEEINHPYEFDENERELESSNLLPQDESFNEIPSHIQQLDEMSDHDDDDDDDYYAEDAEQGVSEMDDSFLEDAGLEEKSMEQVNVEESTESPIEKDINESAAEAGLESVEPDNEDLEEHNHKYRSTNDFAEDADDSTSDLINSRSLMQMKYEYVDYSDETNESKSEVIDVLDEVHQQCSTHTGEHDVETSADEEKTSKIMDSQLNDSETEVTEDMRSNEIFHTDVMDASENDLNTENVNEGSDLDSDAEEMDPDILSMLLPSTENIEDNEDYGTHEAEAMDDALFSQAEEADPRPLETEHSSKIQEQTENTENYEDLEDQLEEQRDESQELTLNSENLEDTDSSEPKEECSQPQEEEDIMDIPLDDPEANKAAAKIQAGFRGHMTRKKMKPGEKPSEEVSSSGEALNGSQGGSGGTDGVETDTTSGPEQ